MIMKIAIVGSREWTDEEKIVEYIHGLPDDTVIISGGARGVDGMAEKWARFHGLKVIVFQAEWGKFGKSAGMMQNSQIVSECDTVTAFWDGKSKGTQNTIHKAQLANKPVKIIYPTLVD